MAARLIVFCLFFIASAFTATCGIAAPPDDFPQMVKAALAGRPGGAVVMRANDGRVLAVTDEFTCCRQLHSPGSVFKLVTALGALTEQCADDREVFTCSGRRDFTGITLFCTIPNGHKALKMPEAIAQSCNVTFYELGIRLGYKRIVHYARLLGLDRKCPGYAAGQTAGTLPARTIHPADTARLGIGQAPKLRISVLGAAEMTRHIAVGDIKHRDPARIQQALSVVRRGMRESVTSGTCRAASLTSIKIAGKTGSTDAMDDPTQRSAWFVGYAPYNNPEIVVAVFVKRGRGFDTAAPIAARIFSAYFDNGHQSK